MYPTQKELLDLLEVRVERHIKEGVATFQNLTDRELLRPAPDGGWSIVQCLDHLNSYGHYYLPLLKKKILSRNEHPAPGKVYRSSMIGGYFIRMVDPETGKKKQKAFEQHQPVANPDAHAVTAEFIRQQEELLAILNKARMADLTVGAIPVSFFKWIRLRPGDLLLFLIAHNERHILQAKKVLESKKEHLQN